MFAREVGSSIKPTELSEVELSELPKLVNDEAIATNRSLFPLSIIEGTDRQRKFVETFASILQRHKITVDIRDKFAVAEIPRCTRFFKQQKIDQTDAIHTLTCRGTQT